MSLAVQNRPSLWAQHVFWLGAVLFVISIGLSTALLSISVGIMGISALWGGNRKLLWKRLRAHPVLFAMIAYWLYTWVGLAYTPLEGVPVGLGAATRPHAQEGEDINVWGVVLDELRIQLPLLILPLSFAAMPTPSARQYRVLAICYCSALSIVGLGNIWVYLFNHEEIDTLIRSSKSFPVVSGVFHIYFSLMCALATLWAGYYMLLSSLSLRWRLLFGVSALILLANLHVVAGRTGILAFWVAVFFLIVQLAAQKGKLKYLLIWLLAPAALLAGLFITSGAFQNRLANTQQDFRVWQTGGDITHWSISKRLAAWQTSVLVGSQSPYWGVGTANIELAMDAQYRKMDFTLDPEYQVYTHNQFIESWLGYGLPGLVLVLLMLILPLCRSPHVMLTATAVCLGVSFCVESLIERQLGVSLAAFFLTAFSLVPKVPKQQNQIVPSS